jgi:hypothetical protein
MKVVGITSTAILSLLFGIVAPVYARQQSEKQDHPEKPQAGQHEQAKPEQQHAPQQEHAQQQQQNQNKQHAQQQEHAQQQNQNKQEHAQQQQQNQNKQHAQQQEHAQQQQRQDRNKQEHAQQQNQNKQEHAQQQQRQGQNKQQQLAQQQRSHEQPQRTQEQQRVEQTAWQQHRAGNWQSDHRTWQQRGGYSGYRIPDNRYHGYFGPSHGFRIEGLPFLVVGGYPRFQYGGYWFSLVDPWPGYWANDWYDTDDVYVSYVDNGYYLFNRRYPTTGIAISISM